MPHFTPKLFKLSSFAGSVKTYSLNFGGKFWTLVEFGGMFSFLHEFKMCVDFLKIFQLWSFNVRKLQMKF